MMNRFSVANQLQNNNNALVSRGDMMNSVVCPKPRRLNPSINDSVVSTSSSRCRSFNLFHQTEMCARTELLDMILTEEDCYDGEKANNIEPSSPPFFCGSPPTRASNPVVQDARFGSEEPIPYSSHGSPSSSGRGSCARGRKHPAVRVVGFNSRGIPAVA